MLDHVIVVWMLLAIGTNWYSICTRLFFLKPVLYTFFLQELRNMIELNCQVMVQMTHLVLPKMVEKSAAIHLITNSFCDFTYFIEMLAS